MRGRLGPLKVYVTPGTHRNKNEDADAWREVYAGEHACSFGALVELALAEPVVLAPGGSCGLYVHSTLRGDEALVYDNQRAVATHEDLYVVVVVESLLCYCTSTCARGSRGRRLRGGLC